MTTKTKTHKAKYAQVKHEHQERHNQVFTNNGVFWAFSNEQFDKNRPADKSIKIASIGSGGYIPRANVDKLIADLAELDEWYKQALKAVDAEEAILDELNNHEAFYTGSIEYAMPVLAEMGYTEEQVKKVYHANNRGGWIN
jgi:hypothetical protein